MKSDIAQEEGTRSSLPAGDVVIFILWGGRGWGGEVSFASDGSHSFTYE